MHLLGWRAPPTGGYKIQLLVVVWPYMGLYIYISIYGPIWAVKRGPIYGPIYMGPIYMGLYGPIYIYGPIYMGLYMGQKVRMDGWEGWMEG